MNSQIHGLTINGTHAEMVDFVELWQTRAVSLAAFGAKFAEVPNWKEDRLEPASAKANNVSPGSIIRGATHLSMTPEVVAHIDNVTKRYAPVPKVKHTDVTPADAPVTKVPVGASGKKEKRVSNKGAASRLRLAIFNGKTTTSALMSALKVDNRDLNNNLLPLIKQGDVASANLKTQQGVTYRSFSLTEQGVAKIEADKARLRQLGILP